GEDYSVGVSGFAGPIGLLSASSEKNGWKISLPPSGSGIEDRSGGTEGDYSLHLVFSIALSEVGNAAASCGSVASFGINANDASQVDVDLSDGRVNREDYHQVRSHFGERTNRHNFRADVSGRVSGIGHI